MSVESPRRDVPRSVWIGLAVLVLVGLGAWAVSRGDDEERASPRPARGSSEAASEEPELADGRKPRCDSCLDGGVATAPLSLEQLRRGSRPTMPTQEQPPDTMNPPLGDAGLPPLPPPPLPDDLEVSTPEALRARQEDTIRTIEARLVQVERALQRAEERGEGVDVIRHRRDQLVSRRDRLREVIANGEAEIHVPSP